MEVFKINIRATSKGRDSLLERKKKKKKRRIEIVEFLNSEHAHKY